MGRSQAVRSCGCHARRFSSSGHVAADGAGSHTLISTRSPSAGFEAAWRAPSSRSPKRTAASYWPVIPISTAPSGEKSEMRSMSARGGSCSSAGLRSSTSRHRLNGVISITYARRPGAAAS
jgi:hypothetical protein